MAKYPEMNAGFEWYDMSREEKQELWWKRINFLAGLDRKRYFDETETDSYSTSMRWWGMYHLGMPPMFYSLTMFYNTILSLGNEQQQKEYLPRVKSMNMIGCYAHTELGHGSNVGGLETTATLDMETDEWVINTPNIQATKFWPGSLGVASNWAMVHSRIIVNGKDYGPQPVLVQIRSYEGHMPMKGIKVGELGSKLGYNSVDNGWLSFDHVRVPRTNLMSRFSEVTKDGELKIKGDLRILYGVMVQTRLSIIDNCNQDYWRSLVIATRYAACRRQFSSHAGSTVERKLIDY